MAKKKVAKKVAVATATEAVFNINVMEYFITGKKQMRNDTDYELSVEGNKFYYQKSNQVLIAVKDAKGNIVVNGDENEFDEDIDYVIEELQSSDKAVTTSFECLGNAGIKLDDDFEVVNFSKDLDLQYKPKDKGYKDLAANIPGGATLNVYRNYSKKTGRHTGAITSKRIHRAGSLLIKYKTVSYICGQDDDSYFISQLKTSPKTVDAAFKALVPSKVKTYEKKTGEQAKRQGEWFFIKSDIKTLKEDDWFDNVALPLKSDESNPHTASYIQAVKGKQYVRDYIEHEEHGKTYLDPENQVYEAIESNHVDSWSVQGVD